MEVAQLISKFVILLSKAIDGIRFVGGELRSRVPDSLHAGFVLYVEPVNARVDIIGLRYRNVVTFILHNGCRCIERISATRHPH